MIFFIFKQDIVSQVPQLLRIDISCQGRYLSHFNFINLAPSLNELPLMQNTILLHSAIQRQVVQLGRTICINFYAFLAGVLMDNRFSTRAFLIQWNILFLSKLSDWCQRSNLTNLPIRTSFPLKNIFWVAETKRLLGHGQQQEQHQLRFLPLFSFDFAEL